MTIEITKGSDNPITDFFSSQSNTPETDAATHDLSDYGPPVPCSWGDWVAADFARKLERERDEAREQNVKVRDIAEKALDFLSSCGASETEEWVQLHDSLDQLKGARNE